MIEVILISAVFVFLLVFSYSMGFLHGEAYTMHRETQQIIGETRERMDKAA